MRIIDSSVAMRSVNQSYKKSMKRSGSFFEDYNELTGDENRERDEMGKETRLVSREPSLMSGKRLLSDRINRALVPEMSPSDELSLRVALFKQMLDVIIHGPERMREMRTNLAGIRSGGFGIWKRTVFAETIYEEHQETGFESSGVVRTADGRQISFGVQFLMSRTLAQKFSLTASMPYILTDPLVINLSDSVTHVSDQKFYFDLDCDGREEEMHFAGDGSGFLALDKNGDGQINDGSELFGTESGDGFKDLAEYDRDGNGWIDENDEIFDRLKVWTKDSEGNDILLSLKEADVGAIFLESADTRFSLYSGEEYGGELRKSGVYLRESTGAAGLVSHVDLAT